MSKILELREKRAGVWDKAKTFLDEKRNEDGFLSQEDTQSYEKMEADVVNLGKEIERLERQSQLDLELSKPTSNTIKNTPTNNNPDSDNAKTGRATENYKKAFWATMRNKKFNDVQNALTIGEDADGGLLAPDEFEKTLIDTLQEENVFRKMAHMIYTSSGDKKIPVIASKGEAAWIDESGNFPEADDKFGLVTIGAFKLATLIKVSDELLNDSVFDIEGYIAGEFARRIGEKEEQAFFVGDGVGKPTGVFDDVNGGELGVTSAAQTALKFDEIIDLYYSLRASYRKNANFVMNDTTVKAIRKLKDSNNRYLWQPALQAGQPDTILNKPLITSSYIPEIEANNKVMAFGDFSYYWIAQRQGYVFQRLNELFAINGQVGFKCFQRIDGKLILKEAVKVLQMKETA